MTTKAKVAKRIRDLQAQADAICRACSMIGSSGCAGPNCREITNVINEIDPLVTEYFRIELLEKRRAARLAERPPLWQCLLPLEISAGGQGSPETLAEERLLPRVVAAAAESPLGQVSSAYRAFPSSELRLFVEEAAAAAEPALVGRAEGEAGEQGAVRVGSRARHRRRNSGQKPPIRHPSARPRAAGR
jgi:hypothetical protein